jgi:hypothetical protein
MLTCYFIIFLYFYSMYFLFFSHNILIKYYNAFWDYPSKLYLMSENIPRNTRKLPRKIIFYVHYIYVNLPYNEMSLRDTE